MTRAKNKKGSSSSHDLCVCLLNLKIIVNFDISVRQAHPSVGVRAALMDAHFAYIDILNVGTNS